MITFILGFSICLNVLLIVGILIYLNIKKNLDMFSNMTAEEKEDFRKWGSFYS